MIRRLARWWHTLVHRRQFEAELDEELAFHQEQRTRQLCAQGLDPAAARRQARLELGMVETHREAVRQARGLAHWDRLVEALRLAWRSLWRAPGFTITATLVLSLPLAAGILLYTFFATYALHIPPLDRPQSWVYLEGVAADHRLVSGFNVELARQLRLDPPAQLDGLFTHVPVQETIHSADTDFRGMGAAVSDNFFALTGIPPLLGRLWFGKDDERDRDALILSEQGWQKFFGRAPDVLGRSLQIGDRNYTVIGVTGRSFAGIMEVGTLYYVREQDPPRPPANSEDDMTGTEVGGFLSPGASLAALNAALGTRAQALTANAAPDDRLMTIQAVRRHGILRETDRQEALLAGIPIGVIVLLILVVAAANLANLVLARFAARRHDLALRAALGAGRTQLFAHLLTECLLLGLLAGVVAMLLVLLSMQAIHGVVFGLLAEMGLDLLPLHFGFDAAWFALGLSIVAALCFGSLPAWWVSGISLKARAGAGEAIVVTRMERRGLRGFLMTLQLALSVFLVVLAGLVASNARQAMQAPLGFDPAPLVAIRGPADGGELARALRQHRGVSELAATSGIPFIQQMPAVNAIADERSTRLRIRYIDAQWWSTLALRTPAGRAFRPADEQVSVSASRSVPHASTSALLSRRAAELLWPGQSALDRSLNLEVAAGDDELPVEQQVQIVGIMEDHATGWLIGEGDRAVVYLPAAAGSAQAPVLLLRLAENSPANLAALQRDCRKLETSESCEPIRLADALRVQRAPFAVAAALASTLAWLALAISCVGLYGLVGYAVEQQRRELGVRFALGARRIEVILQVMRGALLPLAWGLLLGLAAGLGTSRVLAHFSEYLRSASLQAFLIDPLILVGIALLAAWMPARRASRIALSDCLRSA